MNAVEPPDPAITPLVPSDRARAVTVLVAVALLAFATLAFRILTPAMNGVNVLAFFAIEALSAAFAFGSAGAIIGLRKMCASVATSVKYSFTKSNAEAAWIRRWSSERPAPAGTATFAALLASVILLAVGVVVLVLQTGGLEHSPFLQLILTYLIGGMLLADDPRTQVYIWLASLTLPCVIALVEMRISVSELPFSSANFLVAIIINVVIAGSVNLVATSTHTKTVARKGDVAIRRAQWGAGPVFHDVSAFVAAQLVQNGGVVWATNDALGGDPTPGVVKSLEIDYERHREAIHVSVPEGQSVTLE